MVFTFTLPTTSPLSFQTFIGSTSHPSLPQSASTARHALRLALKAHKRLPRGPRQDAHLPIVLSALNEYIPYISAISYGLRRQVLSDDTVVEDPRGYNVGNPGTGEDIEITVRAEIESEWKPTLSASSGINIRSSATTPGATSGRSRGGRISGRGIEFEFAFTLTTLGYVLSRLARAAIVETLYSNTTPTNEQRTIAFQTATKHLLQASSVHGLLATSPIFTAATASSVLDINASTQSALSSLALAEATLLAVLKDDAYVAACIQARNPNDREWMVRAPEIPKVRALLFARLCVRAAEYAEQAAVGLGVVGSGKPGRLEEEVTRYSGALGRVARARACRFFGIDAELAGKVGEGIAWLRAARTSLGLRGQGTSSPADEAGTASSKGGLSRFKREWTERREHRKMEKDAGGSRGVKGSLDPGDDAGRGEEGNVIDMLETKWTKMNDTINTQAIPPSAPLLANLPSGRDIHTPPPPYNPPPIDEDQFLRMRAPPSDHQDLHFASDPDDSEDEEPSQTPGIPGGFPDRTQTASNVYY
ncbi:uncharacterized protein N7469_001835 [Penicillium citrinum]|uniref:pH-response regulator protein palC n=2 Tax=Penicillium TaxID=5073 RepID=A0A9W9PI83_PENCI|nr:uncharacterized protein N7469_001835 [Penicillium citrinum]KAJ5243508.1 hypothetical protein N7469_001835 [Penicillium citrinum]KAJ5598982.1 hypothetical protein N7450_000049 [Penicillium hetheringtonii]